VNAVDDPPTLSDVSDQTINEDGTTGALTLTVADVDTALNGLVLSALSSNPTLVPVENIVFGGSGAARTVTVTPVGNGSGTATITLRVSDGTLLASDTFVLTVNAVDDPPTLSDVSDQTINEDGTTGALTLTVGDVDTALDSLVLSALSSNPTLVPVGNGSGTATITLRVSDGTLLASDTFVLTVNAVDDPPTLSDVSDQTINEDGTTGALTLTVADVDTALDSLVLSALSSNPTLVPVENIVFGGSGAARTVTVTPMGNGS